MTYALAGDVRIRRVGEEAVIVDLNKGTYYSLNEAAVVMLDGLLLGQPCHDIVLKVLSRFDAADQSSVARDLELFVASLVDESLLKYSSD